MVWVLVGRIRTHSRATPLGCCFHQCKHWWIPLFSPPAKMQIESVLSHQKRVIHRQPIHTQQAPLSPPCQRGVVLPLAKPGGFHRLTGFHISLYHGEVPTVNPSVTATPCQLPLAREPLGCGVGNGLLQDSDFQQMPPAKMQIESVLPHAVFCSFPPSRKKDRHRAGF